MKKFKYLPLALAALALGACSSDDIAVSEGGGAGVPAGEKGYVSLAISLPTQPASSTRAADGGSVNLDDGDPVEYEVKDATLLLFKGTSESDATFASAYELDPTVFGNYSDADDQITSRGTLVAEITMPTMATNDKLYALVILNNNGLVTVGEGGTATVGSTSLAGKNFSYFTTTAQSVADADDLTGNGFFMSNAPLFNKEGGASNPNGGTVSTLAELDKTKVKTDASAAASDPAGDIYVERAVAKVTVSGTPTYSGGNKLITGVTVAGWTFNVTNKKTYLVRNVACTPSWWSYINADAEASGKYRFVGSTAVGQNVGETVAEDGSPSTYYRTYWGIDPNYDSYVAADFVVKGGQEIANTALITGTNPGYCVENTFNTANMQEHQSTAVVIKAKLTVSGADTDGSFYTFGKDENNNTSTVYNLAGVKAEVLSRIQAWVEANKSTYITSGTIKAENYTVTLSNEEENGDNAGTVTVKSVVYADDEPATITWKESLEKFNTALATQVAAINTSLTINYYKDGYAYYDVRIKHFGDGQTPWSSDGNIGTGSYSGENAENDYLGRWGALRNNWYDINVTKILNIGSPDVPDVTEKWDDPENSYIAVRINILSWAKRSQDAEL